MRNGIRFLVFSLICCGLGAISSRASVPSAPAGATGSAATFTSVPLIIDVPPRPERSRWKTALVQSLRFLAIEHGFRLFQRKTRRELSGPFLKDYKASVKNLGGWGDGDSKFTNYVAHPMQGAVAGHVQIQNDPQGRGAEFGRSRQYWHSRFKAFAWAAGYSTQFELGPISEAAIGNVGKKKGAMGFVDLVVTPVGGLGMMVAEDVLERLVLRRIESKTASPRKLGFCRVLLNPNRSFAGVLANRLPWRREKTEMRDARRKTPGQTPPEFIAPGKGSDQMNDPLWPGVWRADCPAPPHPGAPSSHDSSLCLCPPGASSPEPSPFSILIHPAAEIVPLFEFAPPLASLAYEG